MRTTGHDEGWRNLKKTKTQIVPKKRKPDGTCETCGMPIYWIKVFLKYDQKLIAFEEDPIYSDNGNDSKKLFNHNNMSQARFSCQYSKESK